MGGRSDAPPRRITMKEILEINPVGIWVKNLELGASFL
jgi:hypothetical protein